MKRRAFLSLALVLSATVVFAHFPEGVTYFAVQFPDEYVPTIDGSLDDWSFLSPPYRITTEWLYEHFGMGISGTGVDLKDFAVELMVGWNEATNKLYVGARTYDDVHLVMRATGEPELMWRQDNLQVMIDIDHSGGQYRFFSDLTSEEIKRQSGAQATLYAYAYPNADGINAVNLSNAATWDVEDPYQKQGFDFEGTNLGPGTTTYEIALTPWVDLHWMGPDQSIEGDLTERQIVGLQFEFGDFDELDNPTKPKYHAIWTVSGEMEAWIYAHQFADFMLSPMDPSIEWKTVGVENSTWGRIKASFAD